MKFRSMRGPNWVEASVSVTKMMENTTPTTVMMAAAIVVRICRAASALPLSTQPGKVIWTGNVVLTQGTLKITGSKATGFLDSDNQIIRVIVDGSPATVQQLDDQDLLMRGHASNIDYKPDDPANSSDGIAILTGKAHVDKQTDTADKSKLNQSDGDKITYNTTNSTMTGESNGPEPVHMVFQPKNPPPGSRPARRSRHRCR